MSRLSPQAAMVLALEFTTAALLVERPATLAALALLAAAYWGRGGGGRSWKVVAVLMLLGTWSVMATQGLFYGAEPRTVLLRLVSPHWFPFGEPPGIYLYREGLWHGLVQSLRFDVMILVGAGLLARYALDELSAGLEALRVPAPVCFLFSIALRFLPMVGAEMRATWSAQRWRGYRLGAWPGRGNGWLHAGRALVLPLVAAHLRKAEHIAAALHGRGFSPGGPSVRPTARLTRGEALTCALGGLGLATFAVAWMTTRFHVQGVWSVEGLEQLYQWMLRHG